MHQVFLETITFRTAINQKLRRLNVLAKMKITKLAAEKTSRHATENGAE